MQAAQRAEANHALEYAVRAANELRKPLVVLFTLTDAYPEANERHYAFMLEGLKETRGALRPTGHPHGRPERRSGRGGRRPRPRRGRWSSSTTATSGPSGPGGARPRPLSTALSSKWRPTSSSRSKRPRPRKSTPRPRCGPRSTDIWRSSSCPSRRRPCASRRSFRTSKAWIIEDTEAVLARLGVDRSVGRSPLLPRRPVRGGEDGCASSSPKSSPPMPRTGTIRPSTASPD
ncbi:MAG: hypothetical protein MZW92_62370 [Comamonadaceae bacterium]|nr:hypothetical protein [Comamonadaceae bacterium]